MPIAEETKTNGGGKQIQKLVLVVVLLGCAIGGFLWWKDLSTSVKTDNAKVAGDIVDVSPKVSGRIEKIVVQEGENVKAGQVIATLDKAQYKINAKQSQAALELAEANYSKLPNDIRSMQATVDKAEDGLDSSVSQAKAASVTLKDAKRALDQAEALYAGEAVSEEALQTARSKYEAAEASYAAAQANIKSYQAGVDDALAKSGALDNTSAKIYKAQLKQAQAAYDSAQLALNNSVITAPVTGTVARITLQAGETVSAGQTIVTIVDLDSTWITANIEEKKVTRIEPGQKVDVSIDAYPSISFSGTVKRIGGATQSTFALIPTENTSGNYTKVAQRLTVTIDVDKQGKQLKPGMSAIIKIHTAK